jgi:glycosyltransferase involved in cell wall biosynthesis
VRVGARLPPGSGHPRACPFLLAMPNRLSVLVPAFNESQTIAQVLERVLALDVDLHEVIVVDDGSTDGTAAAVEGVAAQDSRLRLVRQPRNLGKTAAIQRALDEATGDVVIVQDADLEYDPTEIPEVIAPILSGRADIVYGSRFLVRRAARVLYYYHYLANSTLTFLCNLLSNRNMSDIETCYKAFRAGVIKPLRLTSRGFGMEVEITAMVCKTRARTYEVPISYYGRTYEEGKKIGLTDGIAALWYILYYNVIAPRLPTGRAYIAAANAFLAARSEGPEGTVPLSTGVGGQSPRRGQSPPVVPD